MSSEARKIEYPLVYKCDKEDLFNGTFRVGHPTKSYLSKNGRWCADSHRYKVARFFEGKPSHYSVKTRAK